jgi:hypothetical protein
MRVEFYPPKELPREVRLYWQREKGVLEGAAIAGELGLPGCGGQGRVLGTYLSGALVTWTSQGMGGTLGGGGVTEAARGRGLSLGRAEAPVYTPTSWLAWPSL